MTSQQYIAVKMLQTVEVPLEPLFVKGNVYHASEELTKVLISRGYAEALPVVKENKETKLSKK